MINKFYHAVLLCILFLLTAGKANAQFEGYGSVTMGYSKNPLYNYLQEGDQQKESYLNLKYNKDLDYSSLNFSYTGGLMLFNRFDDRNYFEQLFSTDYTLQLVNEDEENSENGSDVSKSNELTFGASAGGRIDRQYHKEFDNYVVNFLTAYRNKSSDAFPYEINNTFSFRNYTDIQELSNFTDLLRFELINGDIKNFSYGVKLSAGIKYYSSTVYDTAKFETTTTGNGNGTGNGHGRGNGNGKGSGSGSSGGTSTTFKQILTQPQANGSHQLTAGLYAGKQFGNTDITAEALYRYNTRTNVRYLAQYVNTTFLSEDIYNDFFSYAGPEAYLKFNTMLPLQLKLDVHASFENKTFAAPAYDLDGVQVSGNREDLRAALEISLGKYFELGLGFGAEISLNYSTARNQSNDAYNDFSTSYASVGIGIGF